MSNNLLINFLIGLIIIEFIIILYLYNRSKKSIDDFQLAIVILNQLIEDYTSVILVSQIKYLKSQHDLNKESKTNSIKLYQEKINKLLSKSVVDIINQLSPQIKRILLRNYSVKMFALVIQHRLQQQINNSI